jgi:hypothetical protein
MTHPALWNSAARPIYYEVAYPSYVFSNVFDAIGYAALEVGAPVVAILTVGMKVWIGSGAYAGDWIIIGIVGITIVINTDYGATAAGDVSVAEVVNGELWAGYQSTHAGYSVYPFRRIATIAHPPQLGGTARIDVSGYVSGALGEQVNPNIGADFGMSIPFRLIVTGESQYDRYAVRGSLPHTLLADFDADYAVLSQTDPVNFATSISMYSMIWPDTSVHGEHIVNVLSGVGIDITDPTAGQLAFDEVVGVFNVD